MPTTSPTCALSRSAEGPRIAIATEPRYLAQRQPAGLVAALEQEGVEPLVIDPARGAALESLDLIVARGRSSALIELLWRAERARVRTINRSSAILAVLDKAAMARALASAGLPTPVTRAGSIPALLAQFDGSDYPLVVKPVFGDNGRGIRVVHAPRELLDTPWSEPTALAQPLIPSDGFDLKLYVVGGEVYGVRKPSPIVPDRTAPAEPVSITPEMRALALRCGLLFGLELFGVDCIVTPSGPVVIEVNDFPNYSGLEAADASLARYVLSRACARSRRRKP